MATKHLKQRLSEKIQRVIEQARDQGHVELADKLQPIYEEALQHRVKYAQTDAVLWALKDSADKDRA